MRLTNIPRSPRLLDLYRSATKYYWRVCRARIQSGQSCFYRAEGRSACIEIPTGCAPVAAAELVLRQPGLCAAGCVRIRADGASAAHGAAAISRTAGLVYVECGAARVLLRACAMLRQLRCGNTGALWRCCSRSLGQRGSACSLGSLASSWRCCLQS